MSVNASVALQLTWLVNVGSCESLLLVPAAKLYDGDSKSSVHSSSSVAQRSHYWPLAQSMVKLQYRGVPWCADVAAAVARRARFLCATSAQVKQAAKVLKLEKRNLGFGLPAAASPLLPPHLILCPERTLHWALAQQQEEKDGRRGSKELG